MLTIVLLALAVALVALLLAGLAFSRIRHPPLSPSLPRPAPPAISPPAPSKGRAMRTAPPLAPTQQDQAARIIARAIYRELKQNGYTPQQLVALVVALIELAQNEMAGDQPAAH